MGDIFFRGEKVVEDSMSEEFESEMRVGGLLSEDDC